MRVLTRGGLLPGAPQVIELDPISVDEAIDSMEAVGHDFYVFR